MLFVMKMVKVMFIRYGMISVKCVSIECLDMHSGVERY